ncbi:MAG: molybdenum cofactor biosynthesis protein MoaE [Oceanococcus sp.]
MKHLCQQAIDLNTLTAPSHASGASILFTGVVREQNAGKPVSGMRYTAHEALAEKALAAMCQEAEEQFAITSCQILHRLGPLKLGEVSVAIAVHSAHRDAAYQASRWAIEALKKRVPIFKQEFYTDGNAQYLDGTSLEQAL